ncbi:MAG: hypothetical protein HFI69_07945 [Lachnospiraceae bacterium]|nr:hypothetical protein [Lachnospiraceae bacterium]
MRRIKSMLLTLICAAVILGIGYLGIVESGKEILRRESVPEKVEYDNVGSNIFYGKIDDDIEIFPWNYYVTNGKGLTSGVPEFLSEALAVQQSKFDAGEWSVQEDKMVNAVDCYFGQLIAYETDTQIEEVLNCYEDSGRHIYYNMVLEKGTGYGNIYFYQDILQLGEKQYQVRIACGDWSVISFCCAEYDPKDRREQKKWKKGKQKLVSVLEKFENELADYVTFMTKVEIMSVPYFYLDENELNNMENAYLSSFCFLDYVMQQGESQTAELTEEMQVIREYWESERLALGEEKGMEDLYYSYQVVELKDMILLLAQGDETIGIYYDPVNQKFCGYNYFYEY